MNNSDNNKNRLWETEFFAVCTVTGNIEQFFGELIVAEDLPSAYKYLRLGDKTYLQLTGSYFIMKSDKTYEVKDDSGSMPLLDYLINLEYDEVFEYLDTLNEGQVTHLLESFSSEVKGDKLCGIIKGYIKNRYGGKEEK